jgi:putative transposase
MAKPYSSDLRNRVIQAIEAGHSQIDVATLLKIGRRTVVRYVEKWRKTGSVEPMKFGGHKKHKLVEHAATVKAFVKDEPDQTLAELQAKLEKASIKVSASAIDRFLKASKITYKKNTIRHRAEKIRRR